MIETGVKLTVENCDSVVPDEALPLSTIVVELTTEVTTFPPLKVAPLAVTKEIVSPGLTLVKPPGTVVVTVGVVPDAIVHPPMAVENAKVAPPAPVGIALNTIELVLNTLITVTPGLNVAAPVLTETLSPICTRSNPFTVVVVTMAELRDNEQFATNGVKVKLDALVVPVTVGAAATVIWVELITDATVVAAIVAPPSAPTVWLTKSPARILVNPFGKLVLIFTFALTREHPGTTKNTGVIEECVNGKNWESSVELSTNCSAPTFIVADKLEVG